MKIGRIATLALITLITGCGIARHINTAAHMHTLAQGVELYKEEFHTLPSSEGLSLFRELTGGNPKKMIFVAPQDPERKAESFLDEWSRPIQFTRKDQGYTLKSAGRDGILGTADDIIIER
jgi:hypothetical protein